MLILVLIGVYLVFKVTTSYEKLRQDNTRSTERYVILREVIKLYKIIEIVVISTQRDNFIYFNIIFPKQQKEPSKQYTLGVFDLHYDKERGT